METVTDEGLEPTILVLTSNEPIPRPAPRTTSTAVPSTPRILAKDKDFLVRFEDASLLTQYNEPALRWKLLLQIRKDLRSRLTLVGNIPQGFNAVVDRLLDLDTAREAFNETRLTTNVHANPTYVATTGTPLNNQNNQPNNQAGPGPTTQTNRNRNRAYANRANPAGRAAQIPTPKNRPCGAEGHFGRDCPPENDPTKVQAEAARAGVIIEENEEETYYGYDEEGNIFELGDEGQVLPNQEYPLNTEKIGTSVTITSRSEQAFIIQTKLFSRQNKHVSALIDSGASRSFIDYRQARKYQDKLQILPKPLPLTLFDGEHTSAGIITHKIPIQLYFEDGTTHQEEMLVTKLHPAAQIVLGFQWLRRINPQIDWNGLSFAFEGGERLQASLLENYQLNTTQGHPVTIEEEIEETPERLTLDLDDPLLLHESEVQEYFMSKEQTTHPTQQKKEDQKGGGKAPKKQHKKQNPKISLIGAAPFAMLVNQGCEAYTLFITPTKEIGISTKTNGRSAQVEEEKEKDIEEEDEIRKNYS
ncbi:hypothetical protein D9758_018476 [Tetrapyrgos nigripes]|uniref:Uncharacterized protein n=1 Tax=Tetrapyrgos nigripes TaxID=182062 RepID=A0A8H5BHG3_9AGAR|nr:hypothetical protein D9758_018476 [Tetrapyrgos nigripes]